jgi:arylsulfatase A
VFNFDHPVSSALFNKGYYKESSKRAIALTKVFGCDISRRGHRLRGMRASIRRREFLKRAGWGAAAAGWPGLFSRCRSAPTAPPNIVFVLADDLGYGELGCYGQRKIRTPHIDRLAAEGILFTQHYSGSPVCAPSRCNLLTGKHTGHSYIRDNDEMGERGDVWHDLSLEGQRPLLHETATIGTLLKNAGYRTGAVGKWGLGGPGSTGQPNSQGFDFFYGYLCQRLAHNYYPPYLWKNNNKEILGGNEYFYPHQRFPQDKDPHDRAAYARYSGKVYSSDRITEEALGFIRKQSARPFFLYLAFTIPHAALQVPEDSLREYEGAFPETPYLGDKGYLPHPTPRAAYAAMVSRMDRSIGQVLALLQSLGIDRNTLVFFSSDNGPTYNGGTDSEFFQSAGPLRGLKGSLYEGGIRVPLVARWPGRIKPGTTTDHLSAFWDVLPTLTDLLGVSSPPDSDGVSFLPTLLGQPGEQKQPDYLYWEYQGKQALRMRQWKAIRTAGDQDWELYKLDDDIGETRNLASEHPGLIKEIAQAMAAARTESKLFPLVRQKGGG